jgi:hypothetical protein
LEPSQQVRLQLDLIAAIPGRYTGPPSYVYLEDKTTERQWNKPLAITIARQ